MRQLGSLMGALLLLGGLAAVHGRERDRSDDLPTPAREFRGVWVASVANIDWPSRPGLSTEAQKAELIALLDRAARLKLNAIVFQVRPACDALYASRHEPWSEYLTGQMGKAPAPFYDPLEFAVEEAHRRGLELHAWFNPYRARHSSAKSPISDDHISKKRPELVRQYGRYLWLDPGEPEVQKHSLDVIRDVVRRYDIDGVHIDDYFYPYKERDAADKVVPFPDDPSWAKYRREGGKLSRDDWRRDNVNQFVRRLYESIKDEKPWVKFGVSPFGIWRPGNPSQIQGFDPYLELYADSKLWLEKGWLDYFSPQLYWKIEQTAQSYPVLLRWWSEQNARDRHLWPGNYTSRVADGTANWVPQEVVNQIDRTRRQPGATGNIHFSAKVLMQNRAGLADVLGQGVYASPALVPASEWLDDRAPGKPKLKVRKKRRTGETELSWKAGGRDKPWLWVLRLRTGDEWKMEVLPAWRTSRVLTDEESARVDEVGLSAVDRCGNEGRATRDELD